MAKLTKPTVRDIIDHFAKEINDWKREGHKPEETVIDFRDDRKLQTLRKIWLIPLEFLLFRKDNGRISSDVLSYERNYGTIQETEEEGQQILRDFLKQKDPEKTEVLKRTILHDGQREPAIITCDGFLINGNRRKMVLEILNKEHPGNEDFKHMKVVILPGFETKDPQPTLLEIEEIENRYQLQSDGKAEYYSFDRALSIRRKCEIGLSLEEQLKDDPTYAGLSDKDFKKEVAKITAEYLNPLACIDKYLSFFNREGLYDLISSGQTDREGRWEAFKDYSKFFNGKLKNESFRVEHNISEDEIGELEDIAFKIIRYRNFEGLGRLNDLIRDLPSLIKNSRKKLWALLDVPLDLPAEEYKDKDGVEIDEKAKDLKWSKAYKTEIFGNIKAAKQLSDNKYDKERPLDLLEAALAKLDHKDMNIASIAYCDFPQALKLTNAIQVRAKELTHLLFEAQKERKKLESKGKDR